MQDISLDIELNFKNYPFFILYQLFIKHFISDNPQVFIFISAIIVQSLFVWSYYKYSSNFFLTILLYILSGLFLFTMAAIKQTMAMAIVFGALPFLLNNKPKIYILFIIIASLFHPLVVMYLSVFFFRNDIWTKKIILLLIATFAVGLFFEHFTQLFIDTYSIVGERKYGAEILTERHGMNVFRTMVFGVIPLLSFIFRKKIRGTKNKFLFLCVNTSVVSFLFTFLALFGGANSFGRLAQYFEPFNYILLPYILTDIFPKKIKIPAQILCVMCYLIFFYFLMEKFYRGGVYDLFHHVSILNLFL
jgi:hypothetical protein